MYWYFIRFCEYSNTSRDIFVFRALFKFRIACWIVKWDLELIFVSKQRPAAPLKNSQRRFSFHIGTIFSFQVNTGRNSDCSSTMTPCVSHERREDKPSNNAENVFFVFNLLSRCIDEQRIHYFIYVLFLMFYHYANGRPHN